jgi:predicted permease
MVSLIQDMRYAIRQLRRAPGFTLTALLTLWLGIGSVVAVFSVVYSVLLRPYGFAQPGKLVVWRETIEEARPTMPVAPDNYKHYLELKSQSRTVADAAIVQNADFSVATNAGDGHPELLHGLRISPNLLKVLGVTPAMGRAFLSEEAEKGRDGEVILTWSAWRRLLHGDPDAVGRTVRLGGRPMVVVGVLPQTFRFPTLSEVPGDVASGSTERYQIFEPLVPRDDQKTTDTGEFDFVVLARLRPGVSITQAQSELDGLEKAQAAANHVTIHLGVVVASLAEDVTSGVSTALWLLLAATGGVLLIACVNLANLQLARGVARERDVAMRAALGAGRLRLMQSALAESLVLALCGGSLGVALAYGAVRVAALVAPTNLPRLNELALSSPALLVAMGLVCGAALLFGMLPALANLRVDPQRSLQTASSGLAGAWKAAATRRVLVASEIALSVVLLSLTGLAARSFVRVMAKDRHFAADHVILAQVQLDRPEYADEMSASPGEDAASKRRDAFIDQALERLRALPGVTAAGITNVVPLTGDMSLNGVDRPDHPLPEGQVPMANMRMVSPGYFEAMGIPLLSGRAFDGRDREHSRSAIVSEKTARAAWPEGNPLGKPIRRWGRNFTVVGITADARLNDLKRDAAMFYLPYWSWPPTNPTFIVRSSQSPELLSASIRRVLWSVDPQVAIPLLQPLAEQVSESVATDRFQAMLFTGFGLAALLLAALGVYGVLAYTVSMRRREFGVRLALGSQRAALVRLVLLEASQPVGVGLAAGLMLALLVAHTMKSLLYETASNDPLALGGSLALLLAAATVASLLPARRAAETDPMTVLREN